jgi:hypothetical protein
MSWTKASGGILIHPASDPRDFPARVLLFEPAVPLRSPSLRHLFFQGLIGQRWKITGKRCSPTEKKSFAGEKLMRQRERNFIRAFVLFDESHRTGAAVRNVGHECL